MCLICGLINPFGGDWLHEQGSDRVLEETDLPGGDVANGLEGAFELFAGDVFNGSLGTEGDWDWFLFAYEAGVTYTVTLAPGTLTDPLIHIFDASGGQLGVVDTVFDGGTERFTFTPDASGWGYIVADSYYNTDEGRDTGFVDTGTYTLSVTLGAPPPPPASVDPLDAITWNYTAPSVVDVYFAPGGVIFDDGIRGQQITGGWDAFELQQALLAFATFEAVANVTFNIVTDAALADFFMVESTDPASAVGYWGVGGGTVTLEGTSYALDGWGVLYDDDRIWTPEGIAQGGFGFYALIHEIGHGMGLAHPHDRGGGSTIMNGVSAPFNDLGDFDLNQGITTVMSYNPGWRSAPHGTSPSIGYGLAGTPMAFDIAVLQAKYGANLSTNTGDDSYLLPVATGAGSFYAAIWDAGGIDTIRHDGSTAAVIDLRPAPLTYAVNGGGHVSYVAGIHGGFTIAAGVVIENAVGGRGSDLITGNDAANSLIGNGGKDRLFGEAGNDLLDGGSDNDSLSGDAGDDTLLGGGGFDTLEGGDGNDSLSGGAGNDSLDGGAGDDLLDGGDRNDRLSGGDGQDTLLGGTGGDILDGGAGQDSLSGGAGHDRLWGRAGKDTLSGDDGDDRLHGGADRDLLLGGAGDDTLSGGAGFDTLEGGDGNDSLSGGSGNDSLAGGAGDDLLEGGDRHDRLSGGEGQDRLVGGAGNDWLTGGADRDVFIFADGHGQDRITDFDALSAEEKIDLSGITGLAGFDDYTAFAATIGAVTTTAGGVLIATGGGNSILLQGVTLADLDNGDFIF